MTNSIDDIADAKVILATGTNTTENHPVISYQIKKAVRNGTKLIVADPRRIELAEYADLFISHEAGTDLALLNGLAYIILEEGLQDQAFIDERVEGFDEWKAIINDYPPERVTEITGVSEDDLRAVARLYTSEQPAKIFYAMGITQHTKGHENVMAVANLAMITGNMGMSGGGVNPLRGQNNVQGACDLGGLPNVYPGYQGVADEAIREKMKAFYGVEQPPAKPGLTLTEMIAGAGDGSIRVLYLMGENPAMSDADANHVVECLEAAEFVVSQDIFLHESSAHADVVLPAAAFAEKDGTFTNTERRVQRIHQALDAPGEARPDWEILVDLAARLGAEWHYDSPADIMDEITAVTPIYGGMRYNRLEGPGLQWPCPNTDHPGTPILHVGKFSRGKGKLNGAHYRPAAELPDEEYPLMLTTGRVLEHWHTGTMTRRVEGLEFLAPEERVEINPEDAEVIGVADGDWITVSSRRGEVTARAWVTDRPRPGLIFMTFHYAEALGNVLTNNALDPVAKIPEYKVCGVRVEKANGK